METATDRDWWPDALEVLRAGGTVRQAAAAAGRSVSVVSRRRQRARREGVDAGPVDSRRRQPRDGTRSEAAYWMRVRDGMSWPEIAARLGIKGPNARRVVAAMAAHWAARRGLPSPAEALEAKAA